MPKFPKNTSAFKMKNSPYKMFKQKKDFVPIPGFVKKVLPHAATVGATLLALKLFGK